MIEARELRLGNWYGVPPSTEGGSFDYRRIESPSQIEIVEVIGTPIPLTPEILEKCGFGDEDDEENVYSKGKVYLIKKAEKIFFVEAGCLLDDNYYEPTKEILWVHRLQNLYFELTEEELPISFN